MIGTAQAYRATRERLERIKEAHTRHLAQTGKAQDATSDDVVRRGLEAAITELEDELQTYNGLQSGKIDFLHMRSLRDIGDILVGARVAADLTQRGLAGLLGIDEQQVQRYERTRYAHASLARIIAVAQTLGITRFDSPAKIHVADLRIKARKPACGTVDEASNGERATSQ